MLKVARATFVRNTISMFRAYPWSFFIGHILSGVYTVLFAYLTYTYVFAGKLDESFTRFAGTGDYLTYVILGGMLYPFAVSTLMNVSRALITELREGTFEALLLTPSSRKGYFLGNVTQQILRTMLELSVILVVGLFFGLQVGNVNWLSSSVILLLATAAFFCQALVLGSVMLRFRDTYITQNTLFVLMAFVSGVTFPTAYLPGWLQPLRLIMPLTPALQALRSSVIQGQGISASLPQIVHLLILSMIYFVIGSVTIRRMEKRVVETIFG